MTTFAERANRFARVLKMAEEQYLAPHERIAIARLEEIYETYKLNLDPNFQGTSPIAWTKAVKEAPEGEIAFEKLFDIVNALLMSDKFGQID